MSVRNRGYVAWVASLALIAFGAVGCGDDDASSDAGSSDKAATTTDGASGKDAAVEAAAKFQDTSSLEWQKPTEAFDPGTGKVAVISCGNAGINCLQGSKDAQAAATAMGWEPVADLRRRVHAGQAGGLRPAGDPAEATTGSSWSRSTPTRSRRPSTPPRPRRHPDRVRHVREPGRSRTVHDVSTGGVAEGEAIGTWVASQAEPASQDRSVRRQVLPDRRRASHQRDRQDRGVLPGLRGRGDGLPDHRPRQGRRTDVHRHRCRLNPLGRSTS